MSILAFKGLAAVLLIFSGLVGGLAPLRASLTVHGRQLLSLGNAFAGGIFLGAGLIHMLGDSIELFETMPRAADYPWALFICGCGFISILMLEKVFSKSDESDINTEGSSVYPYVLLLVLSIHSIIAGISLGLEGSMAATIIIFIALIAHKGSASFALGVGLRTSGTNKSKQKRLIMLFACMTPLGILLGTLISKLATTDAAFFMEAVFDGLAAGTFLYIATMDIISDSFGSRINVFKKFALITMGFGLMAVIALWV